MATPGKLEAAFDADRSADPLSWTYTDLTALTEANEVAIQRGRSSSRTATADPASASFPLRNGGGDSGIAVGSLTPRKATGAWYPGIRKGLPLRYSVHTGQSYAAFTGLSGSNITTPDAASWNIGADLAAAVQFRAPIRYPPVSGAYEVFGQSTNTGNQRSWLTFISATGTAGLRVSADGATESEGQSVLAIPSPDAGPLTVAWVFDGNNGAGGNTTTFYVCRGTIADLLADPTAFLFGDPDVNSGTITLHNSTGLVGMGDVPGAGFAPYPGCIDRVYVRAGTLTSGTVVADADFTVEAPGTTSFADDAATPKTWTVNGTAEITDRKIRLLGEYGGNRGNYPGAAIDGTAQRTITVAGPLRRMRQGAKPLRSALYRRITSPVNDTTVYAYWPLEDGRDATTLFTVGGTPGGVMAMDLATDDTLPASEALPSVGGGQPFGWNLTAPALAPVDTWEFTMLVNIPVAPLAASSEFIDIQRIDCTSGVTSQWVLRLDDTNWRVFAKDLDGTNVLSASGSASASLFGEWMIVTLSIGLSGANITWNLEMIPLSVGAAFGGSGTLASLGLPAGSPFGLRTLDAEAAQEGFSAGHFIITSGAVAGWLAPADTAYTGEPDTVRVFRLCRENGIPVAVDGPHGTGVAAGGWAAAIAAGAQAMGPQRPLPLLDLLEECAVVGNGYLGETRELLGISYRTGVTLQNQEPRLTVTPAPYDDFSSADDDQHYVNSVEVDRTQGSKFALTATGDDEPEPAGPAPLYEDSRTVNVPSDAHLPDHASWWLHEATWPEERHDTIPVELAKDPSLIDTWHDVSVGDVIEAENLPDAAEAASTSQLTDGWTETIRPQSWGVRPNTRPAGPWEVGVRDDDARAKRDTDGSILDADFDAGTDTSMDVDVTVGQFWTTAAGEFPFDLNVGGAQVTATACGAPAGSVQTFTVSATVANGVTKTVPAGTAVRLWRPTIRAL